ncbi:hypothetical protein [Aeromonas sp. QDB25]|uniref:hypothetical protein n=1 Tax=Aeromonas sp. QDB25 TaxID=2989832 RepID=UPI0022E30C98|nr:hypothetical protein [Aeromonas sp. QDB25]
MATQQRRLKLKTSGFGTNAGALSCVASYHATQRRMTFCQYSNAPFRALETWIRMGKAGSALDSSAGKQSNSCPFKAYPHQMRSAQWSGSWQNGEANRFLFYFSMLHVQSVSSRAV